MVVNATAGPCRCGISFGTAEGFFPPLEQKRAQRQAVVVGFVPGVTAETPRSLLCAGCCVSLRSALPPAVAAHKKLFLKAKLRFFF